MLKRFVQISSLACVLAMVVALPAGAAVTGWSGGSEEDAAAPQGSFTSNMPIPMRHVRTAHHHVRGMHGHHFIPQ